MMCPYMASFLILVTLIISIAIAINIQYFYFKEDNNSKNKEMYMNTMTDNIPQYLNHKGKCFDCEDQMIATHGLDGAWLGQSTKLFSTEKDGISQKDGDLSGGFLGKTMKYY